MDKAAETNKLEDQKKFIDAWVKHPITAELVQKNQDHERALVGILCTHEISNIETFFTHFAIIGELRALRRLPIMLAGMREDIESKLKEL